MKSDIPFHKYKHIRTWRSEGFRLELFNTHESYRGGPQTRLAYQFFDSGWHRVAGKPPVETRIFAGDDFGCSPLHSIDGDNCVAGLLAFFSNDTDTDTEDEWTDEQREWYTARGEYLSLLQIELEEAANADCILCGETGCAFMRSLDNVAADPVRLFVCEECAGIHNNMGPRISDEWSPAPGYESWGRTQEGGTEP